MLATNDLIMSGMTLAFFAAPLDGEF